MTPAEFSIWFADRAPAFGVWGRYVTATIAEKIREEIGDKRFRSFFKIPPVPRVKELESALAKIPKKKYDDPLNQMTDLVGTRFVVLVKTDLAIVENAIAAHTGWTFSCERDATYEVSQDPNVFDYQSNHYLIRSIEDRELEGVLVPADTTCEVQVRTMLQHAYAELVHDNVYKAEGLVPVEAKRLVARCMALMETTDDMFCHALDELNQVNTDRNTWLKFLVDEYAKLTGARSDIPDAAETIEFLDTYRDLLQLANRDRIIEEAIPAPLGPIINRRAKENGLFAKPFCILVYWLLKKHARSTIDRWPFQHYRTDFESAMADLGIAR